MEGFPYNVSANDDYSLFKIYNQSFLQTNSAFLHAYISPFPNNLNASNGVNSSVPKPFLGDAKLPIKLQDLNGLFSDSYAAHVLNQSRDLSYIAQPRNSGVDIKPMFVALSKPNHDHDHDHDYGSCVERGSSVSHQKSTPFLNAVASSRKRKALYKSKEEKDKGCVYPKGSVKQKNTIESQSPKDFIHVRARRGQATDSHSLAERVRREKINERMKILKDLVPGCTKTMGKALMLEEIINYVKSLQNQIELLSMKLAAVSPSYDFSSGINTEVAIESSMAHKIGTRPSSSIEVSQGSHTLGFSTATAEFIEEKPWPLSKGPANQWDGDLQYFLGQHDLWDADLQSCMKNEYQPVLES